ncbi:MAG TPA: arginine--tRNA ligase [Bacilli bacterium]|nr:arginine--tRNA ligase [Bacilli bacterium]
MIEKILQTKIKDAISGLGHDVLLTDIVIETTRDDKHGDYATNIAMKLAQVFKKNPRDIAQLIIEKIDRTHINKIEVAGPGFINFFIDDLYLGQVITDIFHLKDHYGDGEKKDEVINIEFVSANPTGRLHLGHARGAALGDSLARLLIKDGYNVIREFYVNDAGVQINNLGASLYIRYLNLHGIAAELPEDAYHSADLIAVAQKLNEEIGAKYINDKELGERYFAKKGSDLFLEIIKDDLARFRVLFDIYSYETKVKEDNPLDELIKKLDQYIYQEEGALFLKTSLFGDDKDRVIVKSNGEHTYFLPDIQYHLIKLRNENTNLINIFGADHHGYITRMKAALQMFNYDENILDVIIMQLVRLIKDGAELKMSKRTGTAVTLDELIDDVGVDAARYFFIAKSASTHFDFDLDLAVSKSNANPVFYAQYAHARLSAVLERGKEFGFKTDNLVLSELGERNLIKHLIAYPLMIKDSARTREPYKVANYIQQLAAYIHSFYTESKIVDETNIELSKARLSLAKAAKLVMKNALHLIGVSAPDKM